MQRLMRLLSAKSNRFSGGYFSFHVSFAQRVGLCEQLPVKCRGLRGAQIARRQDAYLSGNPVPKIPPAGTAMCPVWDSKG